MSMLADRDGPAARAVTVMKRWALTSPAGFSTKGRDLGFRDGGSPKAVLHRT